MKTMAGLSLSAIVLYGILQLSEGTCSCSSVTGDVVDRCATRRMRYIVGYPDGGEPDWREPDWREPDWREPDRREPDLRGPGSRRVAQYYTEYSCCSGYIRVRNKCHRTDCGGCGSNPGDSERACLGETTKTRKEFYSYSYGCGWWGKRCHRTAYRLVSDTVYVSCCGDFELNGQTCFLCGKSRYSDAGERLTQIVGGIAASVNEFPYQVRLITEHGNSWCGGTILNEQYVLTAGHCVSGKSVSGLTVIAGDHRRLTTDSTEQSRSVSRVHLTGYTRSPLRNDIAVLRLSSTLNFGQAVRPACLPQSNGNFNNRSVVISGWGRTGTNNPFPNELRYTRVYVTAQSVCRARYRDIGPNVLCTTDGRGDDERSSCYGDSGGPMVLKENGRFVVIGVASYVHVNGCAAGRPFGYVDVSRYIDWIEQITGL